jgi:hypothetical protein
LISYGAAEAWVQQMERESSGETLPAPVEERRDDDAPESGHE